VLAEDEQDRSATFHCDGLIQMILDQSRYGYFFPIKVRGNPLHIQANDPQTGSCLIHFHLKIEL
jgi:hypothetical protein